MGIPTLVVFVPHDYFGIPDSVGIRIRVAVAKEPVPGCGNTDCQ